MHQLDAANLRRPNPIRYVRLGLILLAIGLIGYGIIRAIPPRVVTIETGPVGGSYYEAALRYREAMKQHGLDLKIIPKPDSLAIIGDVDQIGSGIDIGFTAQAVQRDQYPHTQAAGTIELQPLFIFYNTELGELATPSNLRGKRIALPPEMSATSQAALQVLHLFEITPSNTNIIFMPLADAAHALEADQVDAGIFMLAPSNAFITDLLHSDNLRPLSLTEAKGITRHLSYLRTTVLPRGSSDIDANVPPEDVELVSATVNVVVRKDIHPAVLYMLLEAMKEVHHGATLISDPGDFPSVTDTDLLPHPLAVEYAKSGMPWIYQEMPLSFASLIDTYFVIGVIILIMAETYKTLKYLGEMVDVALADLCLRALAHIERTTKPGHPVSGIRLSIVHFIERALFSTSKRKRSEELIGRIRIAANSDC